MKFASPLALILLPLLALIIWMGRPARGPARKGEILSLALRLVIILSLILALAGLEITRGGNNLAVVFLLDVSDSMSQSAQAAAADYLHQALAAMGPDDQAAIVLFGGDALVERPMSPGREMERFTSVPVTTQTDLTEAIRLGLALFPSGSARRMVILSDGAHTASGRSVGLSREVAEAARFASAAGVQIVVVPFVSHVGAEALLTGVDVPTRVRSGDDFTLDVSVQASQPVQAVLRILAEGQVVYEQVHTLRRGLQTFSLPLTAGEPGFVNYQTQIIPEEDTFYQNNRLDAFSQVEGPPRVLVAALPAGERLPGGQSRPDEYSALVKVLKDAGFQVDVIEPALLPSDLPGLARYNSVVLVDVPARSLVPRQMESLQAYVHDLGGGLVVIGGPTSYGVGGYYDTPLEAALPVEMQIKDEQRRPSLAIVYIIDHSGSMGEASGGVVKVELAKEAAARSVEMLFPSDRVGVIAFDDTASWVVPMTDMYSPELVVSAIGSIQPAGGTDILAGIQSMARVLPGDPAKVKHVILLTDGGADPTGIPELVEQLYAQDGITLSAVAVGNDTAPFLEDLANIGNGRYHFTNDANSIPSIFTEETSLATRAYIVEEPFFPEVVSSSPILSGIQSTPNLRGYVATSPKSLAQVILKSPKEDPVLAAWQYGLGRSLVFTSDATGRWAAEWVGWPGFASFWVQAVRYTVGDVLNVTLESSVRPEGKQALLSLDARWRDGKFLNGYQVQANVIAPDGEVQVVSLRQSAPGRYDGFFEPRKQGIYLLHITGEPADVNGGERFSATTGWALSYSPEYRWLEADPDLLLRLAALTDGEVASSNPAEVFVHDLKAGRTSRPAWPWLVALAALLLPLDVASRRLILTRQDFLRLQDWLFARLTLRSSTSQTEAPRSQRMDALLQAKGRAVPKMPVTAPGPQEQIERRLAESLPPPAQAPAQMAEDVVKPYQSSPPTDTATSTTASLLARKKLREKRDE